ncbi:DUF2586 family protein [uncultured Microscilla sp.]|uniref:DUF2586 family protein n=1 Tax=uncultured Microscilla sp. TaxID=432653 RepID=UPI0026144DE5|nr:DUF2586 family protein [uncultured Microscilla sp.]
MQRPSLIVKKEVTSLGVPTSQDGISLLVVSAPTTYTDNVSNDPPTIEDFVFTSLKGAEDVGITAAADLSNNVLVWEHVKDFFALANGTTLHVLFVPATTTLAQLFTDSEASNTTLKAYLQKQAGEIKLLGVALNPDYAEDHTTAVSTDLQAAIPLANTFADKQFNRSRPIEVILENRKFSGAATAAADLRGLNSGNVMVVSSRDANRSAKLTTDGHTGAATFAALGLALGKAASIQVNQNIGRLTVPPLFQTKDNLPVEAVEFSGGASLNTFTDEDLNLLHNKGYTFIDRYAGYSGFYFVNDNTCEDATKSNSRLSLNRVANKAARITRATFLNFLKATIQVDGSTGQLLPSVVERFKDVINRAITDEMLENPDPTRLPEISSVEISIDPTQNVLSTKKVVINQSIVPTGSVDVIETIISLDNPS